MVMAVKRMLRFKLNLHFVKLYSNLLHLLNLLLEIFAGVEFLRAVFKNKRRICHVFTSSTKYSVRNFLPIVVQWISRKCTIQHDAHAELFFCS